MGDVYLNGGHSFGHGFNYLCARTGGIHDLINEINIGGKNGD